MRLCRVPEASALRDCCSFRFVCLFVCLFCVLRDPLDDLQTRNNWPWNAKARYIAFTTYTTCVLWLSFVPLFLTASSPIIRVVTLAASFSIG